MLVDGALSQSTFHRCSSCSVFALTTSSGDFTPWAGFGLFVGYTAIAVALASILLLRRDT